MLYKNFNKKMKQFFNKILKLLNLHPDINQRYILASMFVSGLLVTYASPAITKAIISELPAEWLAFEALFGSACVLFVGMIWKGKTRDFAIKFFLHLAIVESVIGCCLAMYLCFIQYNVWIFAIISLIYTSFISIFVGKCIMVFKSKLYNEKERENYDNNSSIIGSIVSILGYTFALFAMPSLKLSLFLWGICCIIDDIGWGIVYYKNNKKLLIS